MLVALPQEALSKIYKLRETTQGETKISYPRDVFRYISAYLSTLDIVEQEKEREFVIGLDTRNKVKYIDIVSVGSLNASLVHPREVFRTAILVGVAQIILAHNHPSGDPYPSEDDVEITKKLVEAGKIIGIEVIDHVIIGKEKYISLKEKGIL